MSRRNFKHLEPSGFGARLAEICGSKEPARIKRSLNISYQAAKNYMEGRLPSAEILLTIAQMTPYSIHWLLTGQGKKFVRGDYRQGAPVSTGQLDKKVRKICVEVINEMNGEKDPAQPKVVVLRSSDILSEKPAARAAEPAKKAS